MAFDSDSYQTPDTLFKQLDKIYNFKIDACTNRLPINASGLSNSKCFHYYLNDATSNWLDQVNTFRGLTHKEQFFKTTSVFMNPPYSSKLISKCMKQAWEFSKHMRIICLVRDDPSITWYKNIVSEAQSRQDLYPKNSNELSQALHDTKTERVELTIVRLPERIKFEASEEMFFKDLGDDPYSAQKNESKNFRRTKDGRIECKSAYNFPCCLMIMDRR